MKFELRLDADKIRSAIEDAESENAESLSLVVIGSIDKDEKVKVNKMYLYGECVTEYVGGDIS
jgi:predicted pyridoxine 5'-phosphate oxidase superfamily flavin-nucleotide-binding protein